MHILARKLLLLLLALCMMISVIGLGGFLFLKGSQAKLSGQIWLTGLKDTLVIQRDVQGIPTLSGSDRNDIAFGLGFVHAQERFFQMDLMRRSAAGELSALIGSPTIEFDKKVRVNQFRKRAQNALAQTPTDHLRLLEAYTNGVNHGLANLRTMPFEYALLRSVPKAWEPEDIFLILYAMYLDLQFGDAAYERSMAVMKDKLPADWFNFLTVNTGHWDAPMTGQHKATDLSLPSSPWPSFATQTAKAQKIFPTEFALGSNNWGVSGDLTQTGSSLIADDMHLGLRVPNTWYRASWFNPSDNRRITGATLPGTPVMIIGSNEHIAWGFTNSYGDYSDLIRLKTNQSKTLYLTPDGWESFNVSYEMIMVSGADSVEVEIFQTQWGPVIGEDEQGNLLVHRWVAHDPEGANVGLFSLENLNTVTEAIALAPTVGIPHQNMVVGDSQGNIGWTTIGSIPSRFGGDGSKPEDWSNGDKYWQGYLTPDQSPAIVNPDNKRVWTANSRVLKAEQQAILGDNVLSFGARTQQIRDRLFELDAFDEKDFLAIQLDTEARFLAHWHRLLVQVLEENTLLLQENLPLWEYKRRVNEWNGQASVDSVGYRLVRRFRDFVFANSLGQILQGIQSDSKFFKPNRVDNHMEYPLWQLVTQRPEDILPNNFTSWQQLLAYSVIDSYNDITATGTKALGGRTWGEHNSVEIKHPLAMAVPALGPWLNMPEQPLPGDNHMPRVQNLTHSASQRMVVSPGHEELGIFHMPAGQSGHPLSLFYDSAQKDWVEGNPSSFLPSETEWELVLLPAEISSTPSP